MGADKDAGKGRGSRLSQSRAEPPRGGVAGPPVLSHCLQPVNPGAAGDESGDTPGSRPTNQDGSRNSLASCSSMGLTQATCPHPTRTPFLSSVSPV